MDPLAPPTLTLDITGETCPMTYVRTRLALDRLAPGQVLAVRLRGADAERNVPANAARQGHAVISQRTGEDGVMTLLLRRQGRVADHPPTATATMPARPSHPGSSDA